MTMKQPSSSETLAPARSHALSGLITVAEGAIVSRVLASSGGGNVTLFAFDGGQGLSEHTAPFDALVQVIDGVLEIRVGEEEATVRRGEVVLMPADVPHSLRAPEPARMVLTMLREPKTAE